MLAVLETLNAELLLVDRQRRLVGAGYDDEGREVAARRQAFGELETSARRSSVGVDGIVEHAEAVLLAQPLVLAAHIGHLAQLKREPQGVERRAPLLPLAQRIAEKREAVRLLGAAGGTLVGDVGGGRRALEQKLALILARRADLQDGPRQAQPRRGVGRRPGDDLAEERHAGAKIVLGEGRVGVAP